MSNQRLSWFDILSDKEGKTMILTELYVFEPWFIQKHYTLSTWFSCTSLYKFCDLYTLFAFLILYFTWLYIL